MHIIDAQLYSTAERALVTQNQKPSSSGSGSGKFQPQSTNNMVGCCRVQFCATTPPFTFTFNATYHPSCLVLPAQDFSSSSSSSVTGVSVGGRGFRGWNRPTSLRVAATATKTRKSSAEDDWKVKREFLLQNKVRPVEANEAFRLQKENDYVILDVRREAEFKEFHPAGATNVQIYRLIKEWTAWDIARRVAFAFFGIFAGTEENPLFLEEVRSKLDKDSKIIVTCSTGGSVKPSANFPVGKQSRSLIAAYLLSLDGYTKILYLEGGVYAWRKAGLPVEYGE